MSHRTHEPPFNMRAKLLLVGLFVVSLAIFAGVHLARPEQRPSWLQPAFTPQVTVPTERRLAGTGPTRQTRAVATGAQPTGAKTAAGTATGAAAPADSPPAAPPRASAEQKEWVAEALTSADVESRVAAIERLRETDSPETTDGLTQVLATDTSTHARLVAIESLKTVAGNRLDPDGAIRAALLAAASDPDRDIATNARIAYEEINAAVGP